MRIRLAVVVSLGCLLVLTECATAQVVIRGSSRGGGSTGPGQEIGKRKFADKPVARVWYSKLSGQSAFQYMRNVGEEMGIQSMFMMLPADVGRVATPGMLRSDGELKGMLVYLTKGLIPLPETLNFRRVRDEAEFRKLVLERKNQFGEVAELIGAKDRYEVKVNFQQMVSGLQPPDRKEPADGEEARPRGAIAFSVRIGSTTPADASDKPSDSDDAESSAEMQLASMSTYFRFHDGIMFESRAPELHEMRLPDLDALTLKKKQRALDLYADIDLSQIPEAFKQIIWGTLATKANAFLQQYDGEPDEEYALRKKSGDYSLALAKAAVLEVDRIQLSLSFASDKEPLRASLVVDARKNSNLAKQLGEVSGGVSGFGALNRHDAPLTISSAWQMPENFRALLKALFDQGRVLLRDELVTDSDSLLALEEISRILSETVDAGAADAIVRLGGNVTDGFALYGGLRVKDADELGRHLSELLATLPAAPENDIRVTREGGREFLSLRLDELEIPGLAENQHLPAQLHFTVAESCLWFSVGGSTSFDTLVQCLQTVEQDRSERRLKAAPFVMHLNLSQWLQSDQADAANRFSELPAHTLERFERAVHRSIAEQFSFSVFGPNGKLAAPEMEFRDSYLTKAIRSGQDELHLEIDTSPTRVRIDARVGEGLIRFFVARLMEVQARAMENIRIEIPGADGGDGTARAVLRRPNG